MNVPSRLACPYPLPALWLLAAIVLASCAHGSLPGTGTTPVAQARQAIVLPDGRSVIPLDPIERRVFEYQGLPVHDLSFPYVGADGIEHPGELMRLYMPGTPAGDIAPPLVIAIHYQHPYDDSPHFLGIRSLLAEGWAVLTPHLVSPMGLAEICGPNLEFTVASTRAAMDLPQANPARIAIIGGSAGGYQALVTAQTVQGLRGTIAFSPTTNPVYNLAYFKANRDHPEPPPIALWWEAFKPTHDWLAARGFESQANRLICPSLNALPYHCPILVTHSTADIIVPFAQIDRELAEPGPDDLPATLKYRPEDLFEDPALRPPFTASIPEGDLVRRVLDPSSAPSVAGHPTLEIPWDLGKPVTLVILYEGPISTKADGHHRYAVRQDTRQVLRKALR